MKYIFLLLLALFLCTDVFGQALDALPGIDQPQPSDRIHTYTRGFSAAFQLDTLRKYFAADIVENIAVDPYTSIPDSLRGRFFTSTSDSLYYVDYYGGFVNLTGGGYDDAAIQAQVDALPTDADVASAQTAAEAYADANDEGSNWATSGSNISRATGTVAIGTSTPTTSELEIYDGTSNAEINLTSGLTGSSFSSRLGLRRTGVAAGSALQSYRNAAIGGVGISMMTTPNNGAEASGALTETVRYWNTGEMTIGTSFTTPAAKLDVQGTGKFSGTLEVLGALEVQGELQAQGALNAQGEAEFSGDRIEAQDNTLFVKKYPGNKYVADNVLNFRPTGTGYLVIKLPDDIPASNYIIKIEVEGYGYAATLRNFDAMCSFFWLASAKTYYQHSKEVRGSMGGGITPVLVDGTTPGIMIGDSRNWSQYNYVNVKRMYVETSSGAVVDLFKGLTWEVRSTLTGITIPTSGAIEDHTPFSSIGTSGSDILTKQYVNVRCEVLEIGSGYQVFKIAMPANNVINGELEISNYALTDNKIAKIHFNYLSNVNGYARNAIISGSFGSNEVQMAWDGTYFYIVLGDGTENWTNGSQMCLSSMVIRGNQAGVMGGVEADIYKVADLSGISNLYPLNEIVNNGPDPINNIYTTSGTAPAGRLLQSYDRPGGTLGSTNLYFARPGSSSTWHTGLEAYGSNGTGLKLDNRVNGSGTTISASLELKTGSNQFTINNSTLYFDDGNNYRGIDFSTFRPGWRVSPTQKIDMPGSMPSHTLSVWQSNKTGFSSWYRLARQVEKGGTRLVNSLSWVADPELSVSVEGGSTYTVKAIIRFEGNASNVAYGYRLATVGTLNSAVENGYTSQHTNATRVTQFNSTFGENVITTDANEVYQVTIEGVLSFTGSPSTPVTVRLESNLVETSGGRVAKVLPGSTLTLTPHTATPSGVSN
jgi:hypothetical protein